MHIHLSMHDDTQKHHIRELVTLIPAASTLINRSPDAAMR